MTPEVPFIRRECNSQVDALYNRVNALERIKYLSGVDLRDKSDNYKKLIDCELYLRHYSNSPSAPIDEDWCKNASKVIVELEEMDKEILNTALEGVEERVRKLYIESKSNVIDEAPKKSVEQPRKWYDFYKKILPKKKV